MSLDFKSQSLEQLPFVLNKYNISFFYRRNFNFDVFVLKDTSVFNQIVVSEKRINYI